MISETKSYINNIFNKRSTENKFNIFIYTLFEGGSTFIVPDTIKRLEKFKQFYFSTQSLILTHWVQKVP
jgi:hypothetical protein